MPDFTKLWDKFYLLGPVGPVMSRSDRLFFWIGAVFVVIGIAAVITSWYADASSPKRNLLSRKFHLFLTTGILLLVWYAIRFEQIPLLSTHVVVLLVFVVFLVWLGFILRYFWRDYRRLNRIWNEDKIRQKYLTR